MLLAQKLAIYFGSLLVGMLALPQLMAPATLEIAKSVSPLLIAAVASLAGIVTAVIDWHVVRRVSRLPSLDRILAHPLFKKAERWAKVAPFFTAFAFAALPLPFTFVRVLMPLSGYPVWRYAAAIGLGRYPRFYVIALFGEMFQIPTRVLIWIFVGGLVLAGIGAILQRMGVIGARKRGEDASDPPAASPPPAD